MTCVVGDFKVGSLRSFTRMKSKDDKAEDEEEGYCEHDTRSHSATAPNASEKLASKRQCHLIQFRGNLPTSYDQPSSHVPDMGVE